MLYILLWLGSLKFHQILCQFAPHMDLQKIDEIMFDNSKYNVLRPTIHITRDHFKDFIQKRDNKDFPGKKVFIDRNGIRHYWTGFEARRPKSLRKAILETTDIPINVIEFSSIKSAEDNNEKIVDKLKLYNSVKLNSTKTSETVKKVRNKPRRKKKGTEPDVVPIDKINDKLALRNDDGKNKIKTTFFCPFFGVVTMVSYID